MHRESLPFERTIEEETMPLMTTKFYVMPKERISGLINVSPTQRLSNGGLQCGDARAYCVLLSDYAIPTHILRAQGLEVQQGINGTMAEYHYNDKTWIDDDRTIRSTRGTNESDLNDIIRRLQEYEF